MFDEKLTVFDKCLIDWMLFVEQAIINELLVLKGGKYCNFRVVTICAFRDFHIFEFSRLKFGVSVLIACQKLAALRMDEVV